MSRVYSKYMLYHSHASLICGQMDIKNQRPKQYPMPLNITDSLEINEIVKLWSYDTDTSNSLLAVKWPEHKHNHLLLKQKFWSFTSKTPHSFKFWCLWTRSNLLHGPTITTAKWTEMAPQLHYVNKTNTTKTRHQEG